MSTEPPSSALLQLVADIRTAVGDPTGKLMQDELLAHCRSLAASSQEKYTAFGKAMWDYIIERGSSFCWEEISDEILSKAHQAGLCQRVIYDPEQHGHDIEADPGCEIWYWQQDAIQKLQPHSNPAS